MCLDSKKIQHRLQLGNSVWGEHVIQTAGTEETPLTKNFSVRSSPMPSSIELAHLIETYDEAIMPSAVLTLKAWDYNNFRKWEYVLKKAVGAPAALLDCHEDINKLLDYFWDRGRHMDLQMDDNFPEIAGAFDLAIDYPLWKVPACAPSDSQPASSATAGDVETRAFEAAMAAAL